MKRWIPFISLLVIALVSAVYFLLLERSSHYVPLTDDVSIIYREACAECHGYKGDGSGFIYPSLHNLSMTETEIREIIRHGALFMPSFPNLSDSIRIRLARYVAQESFRESEEIKLQY